MVSVMMWGILALVILFAVIAIIFAKKGKKREADYYALFIMGVTWLPLGLFMWLVGNSGIGNVFSIIGAVYLIIGLKHRKKWKKSRQVSGKLTGKEKRHRVVIVVVLTLLFLIGVVSFYSVDRTVSCTEDALICFDGTVVSRVGLDCEFEACPDEGFCDDASRNVGACAEIYYPVCAEVNVECVTEPCDPVKETYSNSCEACMNGRVDSYVAGEC